MNKLGKTVKARRQAMGMSLREFGALCGMSHTHIDSIEKGYDVRSGRAVNPTSATIKKLALALGMTESELLEQPCDSAPSTDGLLKFALFGGSDATDEMLEEVKQFAKFIKAREEKSSN